MEVSCVSYHSSPGISSNNPIRGIHRGEKMKTLVRAKAPLRISFAGGGTDVSPYLEERGGVVLSTTIDRYAYASIRARRDTGLTVRSLDYGITIRHDIRKRLRYNGDLDLVKAAINRMNIRKTGAGIEMYLHNDAPPGSGLGSSSTLVVATLSALARWKRAPLTEYDLAELAFRVERTDLGIHGGKQDQYSSAFGGFNFIEFHRDATIVNPLRLPAATLNELEYNLLLLNTGGTRLSARIIEKQVKNFTDGKRGVIAAMDELKRITVDMKNALLRGRLSDFGGLLHRAWENKKKMASAITNPRIDKLYELARKNGALGGKITGAGGGGHMLFYCPFDKKHRVRDALGKHGATVVPFHFEPGGVQSWDVVA
jgi:D-glycero-alpha-D-manno-heptose-7-phosphate kinase